MWFKDGPSPGEEKLTYEDYLAIPQLLSLQVPRSDPAEHDEMQFIIVHQTYELWFRLMLHTLDAVGASLDRDDPREATRLLRRTAEIQRILVAELRVLETMLPAHFLRFRDRLQPASGFQSAQFREIEAVLGLEDERILRFFPPGTDGRARIERRFKDRSLPDRFYAFLGRGGRRVEDREGRLAALKAIYALPARDLVDLCEALLDVDELLSAWRFHHVRMAERAIGAKVGTGGSEGVAYLARTLHEKAKVFPELWEVRALL
jgi:tryptophan 2,3-dioxygenase